MIKTFLQGKEHGFMDEEEFACEKAGEAARSALDLTVWKIMKLIGKTRHS